MALHASTDFFSNPAYYADVKHMVVLTHSGATLRGPMLHQLQKELGSKFDVFKDDAHDKLRAYCEAMEAAGKALPASVAARLCGQGDDNEHGSIILYNKEHDVWLSVYTIDCYLEEVLDPSLSRDVTAADLKHMSPEQLSQSLHHLRGRPAPELVVVDEAHHVCSYQSIHAIFGQHVLSSLKALARVLEILCRRAHLIMLGDRSCQWVTGEPVYPYSKHLQEDIFTMDEVIRVSSRTLDVSNPYCFDLNNSGSSGKAHGDMQDSATSMAYCFPMHINSVPGQGPLYYEIEPTTAMIPAFFATGINATKYFDECDRLNRSIEQETNDMVDKYATQLQKALLDLILHDKIKPHHIAVAYPGTVSLANANLLLMRVRELLQAEASNIFECQEVISHLPDTVATASENISAFISDDKLLWTAAENLAGLERPVVILVGFHLPEHIQTRTCYDDTYRVDSRAFLAVTRCTFRVVFVEVHARSRYGSHFEISNASDEGDGKRKATSSSGSVTAKEIMLDNTGTRMYLPVTIDCSDRKNITVAQFRSTVYNRTEVTLKHYTSAHHASLLQCLQDWEACSISELTIYFQPQVPGKHFEQLMDLLKNAALCNIRDLTLFHNTKPAKFSCIVSTGELLVNIRLLQMNEMCLTGLHIYIAIYIHTYIHIHTYIYT